MLDFFWVWAGAMPISVPIVTQTIVPANGTLKVTFDQAVTGTTGLNLYVGGSLRAATLVSGNGTNEWTLQPAFGIFIGEIVEIEYVPGDLVGTVGGLPLAPIPIQNITAITPGATTQGSTLIAPIGAYSGPVILEPDGTVSMPTYIGPAVTFVLHLLLWKMNGAGDHISYKEAMCRLIGSKVHSRFQIPTRGPVNFFVRSINTLGQHVDTAIAVLDWRTIETYNVFEAHVPEHATFGEALLTHEIGYTIEFGIPNAGSITATTRLIEPVTPQLGVMAKTGFSSKATNDTAPSDEGVRIVSPDFKDI